MLTSGLGRDAAALWRDEFAMSTATQNLAPREGRPEHEQKQLALGYLQDAWVEARHDGVEDDCLAQTSLFLALADLITTYGEEATAQYAEKLSARIRNGEFSIQLARQ
jgi:hypothetical protein